MLVTKKEISLDPRALEIGILLYMKKIKELTQKESAENISELTDVFSDEASEKRYRFKMVLAMAMYNIVQALEGILAADDKLLAYNGLLENMLNEFVVTQEPEENLEDMFDLLGRALKPEYAVNEDQWRLHSQVAEKELYALVTAMTTGAQTTLTKAAFNGATFEQLREMTKLVAQAQIKLQGLVRELAFPFYETVLSVDEGKSVKAKPTAE